MTVKIPASVDGGQGVDFAFDGFLLDMDGTLIDSTAAVEKHWEDVGRDIGVDPAVILKTSHGRRSIDTLKALAPEKATWEYVQKIEAAIPINYGHLTTKIAGASTLLNDINSSCNPWAIVTSASLPLAKGMLQTFEFPAPARNRLITAESVENGKPDPTCYHLGRRSLEIGSEAELLVIEDSPAGIRAGKLANCRVLGLLTSHTYEQVVAEDPDWIVKDLESVEVIGREGKKTIIKLRDIM